MIYLSSNSILFLKCQVLLVHNRYYTTNNDFNNMSIPSNTISLAKYLRNSRHAKKKQRYVTRISLCTVTSFKIWNCM